MLSTLDRCRTIAAKFQKGPPAWIVLAALVWIAYQPSVKRVFVMDQIWYFAELGGDHSLRAGLAHYDYAVSRQFMKGDDALYRPISHAWLGVANWLFNYHHVWWNTANIGLHILVTLLLFRLLRRIHPSPLALPATALFSVLKPPLELPAWNHLGGYLIGFALLLLALHALVGILRAEKPSRRDIAIYVAAFAGATLCHESMVPISGLSTVVLILTRKLQRKPIRVAAWLPLLAPILVFGGLYFLHARRVERLLYVDRPDAASIIDRTNIQTVFARGRETIKLWFKETAVPSAYMLRPVMLNRIDTRFEFSWQSTRHVADVALFSAALALLALCVSLSSLARGMPILALMAASVLAYATLICLGRPPIEVIHIGYYSYFFCMSLAITAYSMVDFNRVRGWRAYGAWIALVALTAVHASETRATTREIRRVNFNGSRFLTTTAEFVDAHKREPGFTFGIANPPAEDPMIGMVRGYPDQPKGNVTKRLSEILFAPYITSESPRYWVDWNAQAR